MDKQQIESGDHPVVVEKWEESERGWGTRPDGFSLHFSLGCLERYIKKYWDGMPDEAPDEYSRPSGTPYEAEVSDQVFLDVYNSGLGLRFYSNYAYPGDGGPDGWKPIEL